MEDIYLLRAACFIVTDGGIYKKRNQIYFDSTDEALIKAFVNTIQKLGVKNININKGHGTFEATFYSKDISNKLLTLLGKEKLIPINILQTLPETEIQEILRILFSTDGGVSFSVSRCKSDNKLRIHRKVTFTSKNKKNLLAIQELLKIFNISSRIQKNGDLEIKGKRNLQTFQKFIGFLEGVKVTNKSKKWNGIEKNKLLEICLHSYRYTHGE